MYFNHSDTVWNRFPGLTALVLVLQGVRAAELQNDALNSTFTRVSQLLEQGPESELPSIRAWRQAYSQMGMKPTQYRCAVEALLRRFRKDGYLPGFHPLIDTLNAESMQAAIPIAAFDCIHISGGITVRPADGTEIYRTFQGEVEHPTEDEIVFADEANHAHSRRWVFRQGAQSVVSKESDTVLVVAEALHERAYEDLEALHERITIRAAELGVEVLKEGMLTQHSRRFEFVPELCK